MKQVLLLAATLSSSAAFADDPPGIVWENTYSQFTQFRAICALQDGTYLAAGSGDAGEFCRIDGTGNVLGTIDVAFSSVVIYAIEPLPDGGAIATGRANADWSLLLVRLNSAGGIVWTRLYGWTGTDEIGQDVEPLADGSFAVCGYREQAGLQKQAWILRTNSAGDTLWTSTFGDDHNDYASGIEDSPQGVIVACAARLVSPSQWGFLASYSLDGELLNLYTYDAVWYPYGFVDICHGLDGGYAFITAYAYLDNIIVGIDQGYQYLWDQMSPENAYNRSWRIRPTMDSGYIVARQNDWIDDSGPPPESDDWNAALSRYDSAGTEMWSLSLERPDSCFFHDVVQLSTGGYIAVGRIRTPAQAGYMVRFDPETGIGEAPEGSLLILDPCIPNPGTDMSILSWASAFSASTTTRVYDTSGRLWIKEDLGMIPEGEHSIQFDLQQLPSGCYLVVVSCGSERAATKLVVLR
jgi:hypothetical protein